MNLNSLESFFNNNYMPHGHCYLWQPHILWTNVISDIVITLAYFSIPFAIVIFANKRKDIGYHKVALLFSAFILLCGITHAFSIYTIWNGAYGWHGILKALTAIVSATTALYVYKLLPELIKIPTVEQYDGMQKALFTASKNQRLLTMQVEQQRLVQLMLDAIPMSGCLLDSNLEIIIANKKFKAEIGQNLEGLSLQSLLTQQSNVNDSFMEKVSNAKRSESAGFQIKQIVYIKVPSSEIIPAEVSLVQKSFDGNAYFVMTVTNLSEIQNVQRELEESQQRFNRALQASQDGLWEINFTTKEISCSPIFHELVGHDETRGKLSISHWRSHIQPGFENYVFNCIKQDLKQGHHFSVEYQGKNSEGTFGWHKLVGKVIKDKNGKIITMSGALRNIQAKKALEQKVQEKSTLLNTVYEGANHGIWVLEVEPGPHFRFVVFNKTAARWLQTEPSQFEGKLLEDIDRSIFSDEMKNTFKINYQACISIGESVTYTESIKINSTTTNKWFQTTLYPIKDNSDDVVKIVGTAIDITPLKNTQEQLSENKKLLENIIDASACGVYLFNITKNVVERINQRFTDIFGYSQSHIAAIGSINELYHQDDRELMKKHLNQTHHSIPGELHTVQMRIKHRNGNWVHCQAVTTILQNDKLDNPSLMLTTFIDMTEQITLMNELEESNSYLQRFAVVASHDLQEPLRKISAFSGMLSERLEEQLNQDEESKYQFDRIIDASNRMSTMITDIMRLSKINKVSIKASTFTIEEAILMAVEPLQLLIDENEAQINRQNCNIRVLADKSLMALMLQNLLANAIKFRRDGVPVITIDAHSNDSSTILTVEDNGIGIESQYTQKIFEAFSRLNSQAKYSGSGIGLAICKQICNAHGGQIYCESEFGVGTKFIVEIPNREKI